MDEDILIRRGARGAHHAQPAGGAERADLGDVHRIEAALDAWAADDAVALLVIDAAGEKAFCAGGDIAEMYATGTAGDFDYGRRFWADEYRMNAKLFNFPKPVVDLPAGLHHGRRGRRGLPCLAPDRLRHSRIAMPECGIGLVPDVGGSLILARAPGRLGEYLGSPRRGWGRATRSTRVRRLPRAAGDVGGAEGGADRDRRLGGGGPRRRPCPRSPLAAHQAEIDALFAGDGLRDILNVLRPRGPPSRRTRSRRWRRTARCPWPARSTSSAGARARHDRGRAGAGIPLHRAGDGAWRLPRRHPRRDHRQGPDAALAA
jgi:hypothetical protein